MPNKEASLRIPETLRKVNNIIGVFSAKGGVGKSEISLNLALSLNDKGYSVGLVDADIHGPSTAYLMPTTKPKYMKDGLVVPPEFEGIKIINAAMFGSEGKPHILRGPMAGNLIKQLIYQTYWQELDYLIIDYPPGTSDIQLSISQNLSLTGALLVSSPQKLALEDTKKSLLMFNALKVPLLGIVETMSYFECTSCNKKHNIMGSIGAKIIEHQFGV